ncbi:MAG: diacylglycerol kinase family protein [Cyclobacteriaceae bacterium]
MKEFLKSFIYAVNGIGAAVREQRNLKVQALIALITVGAGFYFQITWLEWCLILFAIALVIGLEIMNSAVEDLVDLVTQERKPLAGKVKDLAAGAVLFASVIALIIGIIVFRQYLL